VVDAQAQFLAGRARRHFDPRAEGQREVRGGELPIAINLAVRGLAAVEERRVVARQAGELVLRLEVDVAQHRQVRGRGLGLDFGIAVGAMLRQRFADTAAILLRLRDRQGQQEHGVCEKSTVRHRSDSMRISIVAQSRRQVIPVRRYSSAASSWRLDYKYIPRSEA